MVADIDSINTRIENRSICIADVLDKKINLYLDESPFEERFVIALINGIPLPKIWVERIVIAGHGLIWGDQIIGSLLSYVKNEKPLNHGEHQGFYKDQPRYIQRRVLESKMDFVIVAKSGGITFIREILEITQAPFPGEKEFQ